MTPAAYVNLDSNDLEGKAVERQKKKHKGKRKLERGGGRQTHKLEKGSGWRERERMRTFHWKRRSLNR